MASAAPTSRKIVILGCGRVGSTLAREMAFDGHDVAIIDVSNDAFRRLGAKFKGRRITGNGLDQHILKAAGIEGADAFIAVTQGDNSNIMAAQVAKQVFEVPEVVARIYDPIRAHAYRDFGIKTLCTTTIAVGLIQAALLNTPEYGKWSETTDSWDRRYLEQVG